MNYSTTQAGNIAVIAGLLAMIAAHYNLSFITSDGIQAVIGAVLAAGGVIASWVDQYKSGHSTIAGFKAVR